MMTRGTARCYRIQNADGRFDHALGLREAFAIARRMADLDPGNRVSLHDLDKHYGVRIDEVSKDYAVSVGLIAE
jgi:hypothetical protein